MLIQAPKKLGLVNALKEGWLDHVHEHIENGTNFLLLLPKDREEVKRFCNCFGLSDDCHPTTLRQSDFFLLTQFIEPEVFDTVLEQCNDDHQLVFVEQIDFPINRPPKLKHFLVYSPVLGIISQFEHINPAREALIQWQDSSFGSTPKPEAAVYYFNKGRWKLFEGGRPD